MAKKVNSVAVIGAGPAGATAAYLLAKSGVRVDLYEATPYVGGMSRSLEMWGQTVDIGAHRFFSSDPRVNKLWLEVVGKDYKMVDRLSRIMYDNKFYNYPIKAGNALSNLGLIESALCVGSYTWQRVKPGGRDLGTTFESWVEARFGKRLAHHFFKTYAEKLWGIPTSQLDSEFAAQRIKKLSLWEAIKGAIFGGGGEKHKTLVDQFAYPINGSGVVYERMKDFIEKNGGRVLLNTPVREVVVRGKNVTGIKLESGDIRDYDEVISSMPITQVVNRLKNLPPKVKKAVGSLKFRNTLIVYLQLSDGEIFPDNWIYLHSSNLKMGRITNFRNWVPEILNGKKETILALEFWCFDEDDFWKWNDDQYIELAKKELLSTGLVKPEQILDGKVIRVPKCYPVYSHGYRKPLKIVETYLREFKHVQFIGRYGSFKYNNQDHSILMAILAAENLIDGAKHDLWNINSDDEYQESSKITATGLAVDAPDAETE
ncbi:FAD-dependent oxidoreductase [Candidatus Saccharibacteria bacterium]|nr:FAD-dependent oxidoreductase [Candidatus Saccharibacteria bacterium]